MAPILHFINQPESYYVTVSSSSSHEFFPENLNYDFSNKLVKPIIPDGHGRLLECAIMDLYFNPAIDPPKRRVFPPTEGADEINVVIEYRSELFVSKREGRIQNFVTHCNEEARKWNANFEFKVQGTLEGGKFVLVQNLEGFELKMSPNYARAMGFLKDSYKRGTHVGEKLFSQALYDQIDVTDRMNFTMFKDFENKVKVSEPEVKTVSDLISEMNKSVSSHQCYFIYDGKLFSFEDDNKGKTGLRVKISPFLSNLFNIPVNTWFHGKMSFPTYPNINFGVDTDFQLVTCDAIENQQFFGKLLNVLRIFPVVGSTGSTVHVKFTPPVYVPVQNQLVENIRITLCDEACRPIVLTPESQTTVLLHFKSRSF